MINFERVYTIENCGPHFDVAADKLFCFSDDALCVYENANGRLVHSYEKGNAVSLCIIGDYLVTQNLQKGHSIIVDPESLKEIKQIDCLVDIYPSAVKEIVNEDYFYPICVKGNSTFRGKISVTKFDLLENYPVNYGLNGIWKVLKDHFISRDERNVACHLFSDGQEMWTNNFNTLLGTDNAYHHRTFISHKKKLYFFLSHKIAAYPRATFCIDEDTGQMIHRFDEVRGDLMLCKDKVYGITMDEISVLETASMSVSKIDVRSALEHHSLTISYGRSVMQDNLLYFIDGSAMPTDRLGLLDLNTGNLLWHDSIRQHGNQDAVVSNIQIYGDRLYALASDKRLHVYERT